MQTGSTGTDFGRRVNHPDEWLCLARHYPSNLLRASADVCNQGAGTLQVGRDCEAGGDQALIELGAATGMQGGEQVLEDAQLGVGLTAVSGHKSQRSKIRGVKRNLFVVLLAGLCATQGRAETTQPPVGSGLPVTASAGTVAPPGAQAKGPIGDAAYLTDATMAAGSSALKSPSAKFTVADVGKIIAVSGSGGSRVNQVGTIIGVTDAQHIIVSFTAATATPWSSVLPHTGLSAGSASVAIPQKGAGSYAPAELLTVVGGAGTAAVFSILNTQVASAAVSAGGTGGTTGACTVTGTTGGRSGLRFTATGTVAAGALTSALVVATPGAYTTNPANLTTEPVTGCGLTGATLTLRMGPRKVTTSNEGVYQTFPTNPASTTSSGAGTGATLALVPWQGGGKFAYGTDDTAAIQAAVNASAQGIWLDAGGKNYLINGIIALPTGKFIKGRNGRPDVIQVASATRMFDFSGSTDAAIGGMRLIHLGTGTGELVRMTGTVRAISDDLTIPDAPPNGLGTILLFGASYSRVTRTVISNGAGTCIGLSGDATHHNTVSDISEANCGGFGVLLSKGAHHNKLDHLSTALNQIELVGITVGSNYNSITNCTASNTGDDGYSLTGNYNTITSSTASHTYLAGIGLFGAFNTAMANKIIGANQRLSTGWAGITILPGFGGTGESNSVTSNTFGDDQLVPTLSQDVNNQPFSSYINWTAATSIHSGAYVFSGLNIYVASNSATTGTTAPTCTSGTCSDGSVTWAYVNSYATAAVARGSQIKGNTDFHARNTEHSQR